MKRIVITKENKREVVRVPEGSFAGDGFKCSSCGYDNMMKVLGNSAKCPRCGGTMYRY